MSELCPISILIPAKNEISNIRACIESARFADEIVVVDSNSTDSTQEISISLGARVVDFKWNGAFPKKKNWALANIAWKHPWVFILDADERITPELAGELRAIATQPAPACEGYYVNRRFWFLDGWLMHCGYYPSWNLRFFRHELGRYEQFTGVGDTQSGDNEVHEHVILNGRSGHLKYEMEHYAFPTISIWIEKHNRYSNWEARLLRSEEGSASASSASITPELARKRRIKHFAARLPFRPTLRFFYHYVWRRGFLDGYRGYVFCRLMAFYEFMNVTKAAELQRTGTK
ncbi:glycosyltransferase family 2 protein [Rariglobus hedericola]|uniref:Glycosyltransferase family 2 protein n=1 Tax=Rariglobus hedericola TaxID=2597822 RepID=A0A556QPZ8_9BACT|nr:glycosyltransferase family 2 protein [Rariglobus hedericola]TSJ78699.1 glycosyltransferase family 2 protein [Rariglobus hedericola]